MSALIEQLNEKIHALSIDLDNAHRMTAAQRIVCKLIKICGGKFDFILPMTKGRFALHVGIEGETFSRAIPKLAEYGVKIDEKKVTFTDEWRMTKNVCDICAARHTCKELRGLINGKTMGSSSTLGGFDFL